MPTPHQILVNSSTGDRFEFHETAASSGGGRVVIRTTLSRPGRLVPRHLHVLQDERFEVESGQLTVETEDGVRTLGPGEAIDLPMGRPHNHFNAGPEPVVYIHTTKPALDFEIFIANLVGLAADGKFRNGQPGFVQQLATLRVMESKAYLADIPIGLQKVLMTVIPPLARPFGVRGYYKTYCGIDK